ncbi:MAG: hypothetical protein IBX71_08335 [Candidatus Desulforudis sp.]|nr:hypothetical protein [Desulforudis sp.]
MTAVVAVVFAVMLLLAGCFLLLFSVKPPPQTVESTEDAVDRIRDAIRKDSCTKKAAIVIACAAKARAGKSFNWQRIANEMTPLMLAFFVRVLREGGYNPLTRERVPRAEREETLRMSELARSLLEAQGPRLEKYLRSDALPRHKNLVREALSQS